MTDLNDKIQYLIKFGQALENGLNTTLQVLPVYTKQQIHMKAKRKLKTTLDTYMDGVETKFEDMIFIVGMDKDNWLANALEVGVSPFDMKQGLLNSPHAKRNKQGQKYIRVPIQKEKDRQPSTLGTQKQQEYQRLINTVMNKPKFGNKQYKISETGSVTETQKIINNVPELQGFYRFRQFEDMKAPFSSKSKGVPYQYVLFRTVSEKRSKTGATWEHPGLKALNIYKELEQELPKIFETLLEQNIQQELAAMLTET